jgi:hypothetical protein
MGFSGSRVLDDRRRRRLVLETEQEGTVAVRPRDHEGDSIEQETELSRLVLSLPQFVPSRPWKYWCVGTIGLFGFTGILLAWLFAEEASTSGSHLGDTLVPFAERMLRGSGTAAWWLAGQVSCLMWWTRSRSRLDYGGRFHVWGWCAAGFFAAAACCLTDAHHLSAMVLAWSVGGDVYSASVGVTAAWLLPSLVVGCALWATLASDLRNCVGSRVLHSLAGLCGLMLVGTQLWAIRYGSSLRLDFVERAGLAALQWSNLMTVLCHLRHVVHISADPPPLSPSWCALVSQRTVGAAFSKVVSWLRRKPAASKTELEDGSRDETRRGKRRVRLETDAGDARNVRIDDAESAVKGPSKRTRHAARKSQP